MTILKVLSAVPTRYSHQQQREQQSWRSIHRKEEKEMHFPFPFIVYPDSKYLAVIHVFPWNLPKLLKQCRNHPWALLEADPGVSMLMHISSPEYPMALLVFQPQEIPIWSCKAPNSCDSKAHRDLGRHNPPSFRSSCVSHFGKAFPPLKNDTIMAQEIFTNPSRPSHTSEKK